MCISANVNTHTLWARLFRNVSAIAGCGLAEVIFWPYIKINRSGFFLERYRFLSFGFVDNGLNGLGHQFVVVCGERLPITDGSL